MPLLTLGRAAEAEGPVNTDDMFGDIRGQLLGNSDLSVTVRDKRNEAAAAERSIVQSLEESLKLLAKGEDSQVESIQKIATDVRNLAAVQQDQTAATDGLIRQVIENQTAERESLQRLTVELGEAVPALNNIGAMDARVDRIDVKFGELTQHVRKLLENDSSELEHRLNLDRKVDELSSKFDTLITMLPRLVPGGT